MKVLIVDDSIVFRSAIRQAIDGVEGIEVASTAIHGAQAIQKLENMDIDVMVVDLEMPVLDGVSTIREIRKTNSKLNIVVFSAFSQAGADKTLQALAAGAQDFLAKNPSDDSSFDGIDHIKSSLVPKIIQFRSKAKRPRVEDVSASNSLSVGDIQSYRPSAICVGSSTGGPEALKQFVSQIQIAPNLPILITQHMPPMFTRQLANMLDGLSKVLSVKEAEDGELIINNVVYIAPGDFHLEFVADGTSVRARLTQTEKVNSVRPAVDVMIDSATELFPKSINVILTGMGEDGLRSCAKQKNLGNPVLIQSEESCVVFGMPGAIYRKGLHDFVGDLAALSKIISRSWR